jgi:ankyrin repeat protein
MDGRSLHKSAINGQVETVKEILRHHPDHKELLEAQSITGVRPLHSATKSRNPAIVAALLDAGADIDAQEENGITALRQAVQKSYLDVAGLLVSRGAQTDIRATDGILPLDAARLQQNRELVECLREF